MKTHAAGLAIVSFIMTGAAYGQTAPSFYQNKQVRVIIGQAAGGDYDLGGRLLAKYLGNHIPGKPVVIVQNMVGAASAVAANYLYSKAPQDGTVFGSFGRPLVTRAIIGTPNIEPDFRRFNWVGGSMGETPRVCGAWKTQKVQTAADLFQHELIVAGTGPGSGPSMIPVALREVLNMKFRLVEGYTGQPQAFLAMERHEVEGICMGFLLDAFIDKVKSGEILLLLHTSDSFPQYPNVPSAFDFAKTEEQRSLLQFLFASEQFGRPYVLPPNVPEDRVQIIRRAFSDALKDPGLLADAEKSQLDMTFQPPEKFIKLVNGLYSTPPALIETAKKMLGD